MEDMLLEQAELLFLLNDIHAETVISIAPANLFPAEPEQRQVVLQEGAASLAQRGLLLVESDGHEGVNAELLSLITTLAHPKIAILVVHNDHETGLQLFWFYQTDEQIVEHTLTQEKLHKLTSLPNAPAMINRIEEILAVHEELSLNVVGEIGQSAFYTVKNLASQHEHEQALDILRVSGLSDADAAAMLAVLERPLSAGNIALLRCVHETVIDGRNLALLQDEQATWSARQRVPGVPVLVVETTNSQSVNAQLLSYVEELSIV